LLLLLLFSVPVRVLDKRSAHALGDSRQLVVG